MMEYGRVKFVTEHDAKAIKKANDARQSEKEARRLNTTRTIEDFLMCQGMEISRDELNQGRMQQ